jgi:creatinine amidohydrolase
MNIQPRMKESKTNPSNFNLEEMNAIQVKENVSSNTTAIVVLGACENHGDHMPFGADFIFPIELARRIASTISKDGIREDKSDREVKGNSNGNIIILPPMPYGVSSHHNKFQMTMSLQPATMTMVIQDILESLIKNHIKRILILNGHDGNIGPIEVAARNTKDKHQEVVIACLESWWTLVGQIEKDLFDTWNGLGHGGEAETSAMLATRPELVNMGQAPREVIPSLPSNDIRIYWKFNELTDTGATGAPQKASVKKGEEAIRILEKVVVSFLKDMDKNNWKYGTSRIL